jgi:hypothetical protein
VTADETEVEPTDETEPAGDETEPSTEDAPDEAPPEPEPEAEAPSAVAEGGDDTAGPAPDEATEPDA